MTTFKTLLVGATVGALLAIGTVAVAVPLLSSSAKDVAAEMATKAAKGGTAGAEAADPFEPPTFYGAR
jgi:hypothetical protein